MRRPLTNRQIVKRDYGALTRFVRNLTDAVQKGADKNVILDRLNYLDDMIIDASEFAMTTIEGAPALEPDVLKERIENNKNTPENLVKFATKHLTRELGLLGIPERANLTCEKLVEDITSAMADSFDYRNIAQEITKDWPFEAGRHLSSEQIFMIIRESVGLDGRTPDDCEDDLTESERKIAEAFHQAFAEVAFVHEFQEPDTGMCP